MHFRGLLKPKREIERDMETIDKIPTAIFNRFKMPIYRLCTYL